jgi:hypothetical protein
MREGTREELEMGGMADFLVRAELGCDLISTAPYSQVFQNSLVHLATERGRTDRPTQVCLVQKVGLQVCKMRHLINSFSPLHPSHNFDLVGATCFAIFGLCGIIYASRIILNPDAYWEKLRSKLDRLQFGHPTTMSPSRRESKILALRSYLSHPNPVRQARMTGWSIIFFSLLFELLAWWGILFDPRVR